LLVNYEFDEKNGTIRDKITGERCLLVYESGLESVFKGLSEIFKAGIEVLLLESSRASGRHIADSTRKKGKIDTKSFLSEYTKRFALTGLGRLEVSELKLEKATVKVRVWNSIFAELRDKEGTYCSYIAGLLSGMYERLLNASPNVKETKCIGHRDPYCEFHLTLKSPSAL
jgi:predicted hydrocarbon binding protein